MLNYKLIILLIVVLFLVVSTYENVEGSNDEIIMGGKYIENIINETEVNYDSSNENFYNLERFFRPSNMKIINDKTNQSLYDMYGVDVSKIQIPQELIKMPKDTIVNYFSILREAANPLESTNTGCGSLGDTRAPYPIAYNFLDESYKKRVTYNQYLNSFKNILHTNLIKLNQVPPDENNPNDLKYFVELETIQGSNEKLGLFAYYYGYIYLNKVDGVYKIKDIKYLGENYLCAPYHGWRYDAESYVSIEYGDWCSLVDGDIDIKQNGYEKKAYFKDKNNNEYYVLFYQLTNGVDIKIADYKKDEHGEWKLIYIYPEKCLEKNKKSSVS